MPPTLSVPCAMSAAETEKDDRLKAANVRLLSELKGTKKISEALEAENVQLVKKLAGTDDILKQSRRIANDQIATLKSEGEDLKRNLQQEQQKVEQSLEKIQKLTEENEELARDVLSLENANSELNDDLQRTKKVWLEAVPGFQSQLKAKELEFETLRVGFSQMNKSFYNDVLKSLKKIEPYVAKLEEDKRKLEDSLKEVAQVNMELRTALRVKTDDVVKRLRPEMARKVFSKGRALIQKAQADEVAIKSDVATIYTDIAPTSPKDLAMVSFEQLQALLDAAGVRKVLSRENVNEVIQDVQMTIAQLQQEVKSLTDQNATLSQQVESLFQRLEKINNLRGVKATVDYKLQKAP